VRALKRAISIARGDFRDLLCPGSLGRPRIVCDPGERPSAPDEEAFLAAIRRNPPDNGIRLVYADWLEERGDDRRAEYVRLLCRWVASHPAADRQLIRRERELRKGLGRGWLARVRGMRVREPSGAGTVGRAVPVAGEPARPSPPPPARSAAAVHASRRPSRRADG
jgi:uncharacterized protein (TIGR02996 family)